MNIPQALGYTKIAGMPVVTGLYTLVLPLVGFAAVGSSRYLVVAADSATAAIFAGGALDLTPAAQRTMCCAGGCDGVAYSRVPVAGAFPQARIHSRFLSQTVLTGFLTGVGFQVGVAVLGEMLGIPIFAHRPILQLAEAFRRLPEVHLSTLAVSVVVVCSAGSVSIAVDQHPAKV